MRTTAIIIFGLMFVSILIWLRNEWKEGRKNSSNDLLFMLNFKIENSMMDDQSEIYLKKDIAYYKSLPDIDKKKLALLEKKFKERFKLLHEECEHSPESIFGKVKK